MADGMMAWDVREEKQQISPGIIIMDGWELKKLIGRGGFGDVWLAEKSSVGILEQAAVKIIRIPRDPDEIQAMRAEGMSDQSIQAELRRSVESAVREIRVMIDLQSHPAVVQHKGFDVIQYEEDGTWEIDIRMQLLTSLADWINANGGKSEDAVRLGIALSDLLTVCERKHILHRDIKPANIFVDELGNFRLGDFGLARVISEAGATHSKGVGTETFMAPEVFASGVYDHRADLYTLGLVIYWMLNGMNLPFMHEGISRSEATVRRLAGEAFPPLTGVDPELEQIIRKACEMDPDKRWKTAKEFHDALFRFQYKKDAQVQQPEKKEPGTGEKKTDPAPAAKKEAEQPSDLEVLPLPPKPKNLPSNPERSAAVKEYLKSRQEIIQQNKQIKTPDKPQTADLKTKKRKSSGMIILLVVGLTALIGLFVWGFGRNKPIPLFNMQYSDLLQKYNLIMQESSQWTEDTAPRTIGEFPLVPDLESDFVPCTTYSYEETGYTFEFIRSLPVPFQKCGILDENDNYSEMDLDKDSNVFFSFRDNKINNIKRFVSYNPVSGIFTNEDIGDEAPVFIHYIQFDSLDKDVNDGTAKSDIGISVRNSKGGNVTFIYDYEQGQLKHCGINVSSGMTEFYYFFDVNPESGTMDFQKKH